MRPLFRYIALGIAALGVVVALLIAFVVATFDPNDHKDSIVQTVKQRTGRTLVLEGDLSLSLFPSIGARVGRASLSEPNSSKPFAAVESAVVAVKLWPLLSKQVIVDAVDLKGLRLDIERDKSGRWNFEDLAGADSTDKPAEAPPEPQQADTPLSVDIARVEISDADVTFSDRSAGTRYRLSNLDLETGRIASGVATPIELAARIASDKDKARIDTRLAAMLTFDLPRQRYRLDKLDLSAKGDYAEIQGLVASAKGSIEAGTEAGEYVANALTVSATGKRPDGSFHVKLDAPKLTLARDKVEGGKLVVDATFSDAEGRLVAKLRVGSVSGAFAAVAAEPLDADVQVQRAGRAYSAQLNGALTANLDRKTAGLSFSGKLDQSNLAGKVAMTRSSPLAFTFDLNADQLDADRLLGNAPAGSAPASPASTSPAPASPPAAGPSPDPSHAKTSVDAEDEAIDLSALEDIDASGNIRIGKLTLRNIRSEDVRATIKVAGGRLDVAPLSARLYQGTLAGSLSVTAAKNAVFVVRQSLNGIAVGPLLQDAAQIDTLEGRGTLRADLRTRGATVEALKKALNGTASVTLADGSVKGIDIAGTIRSVRSKLDELRGQPVRSSNKSQKTDFSELKASFKITNGVARNDDLSLKSPLLRADGAGDIDIGNNRMNYRLNATLVATTKGQGGRDVDELAGIMVPVQLTGALDAPQWSIDVGGMAASLAKNKLKDEILRRLPDSGRQPKSPGNIEDAIKDRLNGLFGR